MTILFLHSRQQWLSSCCSTFLPALGAVSVLNFCHFNRYPVVPQYIYLQFPNDMWFWTSFQILICHLYIVFDERCAQISCPFCNQIVCFLIVKFQEFFAYFECQSFHRYVIWKYFLLVCGLSLHALYSVIQGAGIFHFNEVWLVNLFFHGSSP